MRKFNGAVIEKNIWRWHQKIFPKINLKWDPKLIISEIILLLLMFKKF